MENFMTIRKGISEAQRRVNGRFKEGQGTFAGARDLEEEEREVWRCLQERTAAKGKMNLISVPLSLSRKRRVTTSNQTGM